MNNKKISILSASVVLPIVIFGIFLGTTDFLKEEQINPQHLPVVNTSSQSVMYSFENKIKSHGVAFLGTVQSVETKILDQSAYKERNVYKEGSSELEDELVLKVINNEITNQELLEIMEQQLTGETYTEYVENKTPFRYITLDVDQYFKDSTGQFADTIIVKTYGEGEGILDGEKVYYPNRNNMEYPVGEQAIYVLSDRPDHDFLVFSGFDGKYSITDDMIQSKFNQYMLEDLVTDTQVAQIMSGDMLSIDNQPIDITVEWNLPIPLDEAIIIATEAGN